MLYLGYVIGFDGFGFTVRDRNDGFLQTFATFDECRAYVNTLPPVIDALPCKYHGYVIDKGQFGFVITKDGDVVSRTATLNTAITWVDDRRLRRNGLNIYE